jgi:hypothetical protein
MLKIIGQDKKIYLKYFNKSRKLLLTSWNLIIRPFTESRFHRS